jgi:FkbM family methyltransferase
MIDDFIARCRRGARATYLGEGRIACRALGRYDLVVDAGDIGMTPNIVCDGFWEPGISVVLERLLKPGMTAVDIGANVGYFSLLMASRVGPDGRVVSIEANPAMAALLRETIAINGLEAAVTMHNVAAADQAGELDFYIIPDRNLNGCILLDEWKGRVDPARLSRVRAATADDILADAGPIDLIKIDVEGAEHLVWKGLRRTLERNPEIVVVLEYNAARHSEAGPLAATIEADGFPLRFIAPDGSVAPVEREALLDPGSIADWMLFLKRGEVGQP